MTLTEYGAEVTRYIDAWTGGYDYPDDFESEVESYFVRRLPPAEAARRFLVIAGLGSPKES